MKDGSTISRNLRYASSEILEYYSKNRDKWDEFYRSEKMAFERVSAGRSMGDVLDVGCACGGLGSALCERQKLSSYTGIDVHAESIAWASLNRNIPVPSSFMLGDIVDMRINKQYDTVISLGCADWNVETKRIMDACWKRVRAGGYFVVSLRLTDERGMNDIKQSFQFINFSGNEKDPERANYVIFNAREALDMFKNFDPPAEIIGACGYWGKPSATARTPYKKLVFAVFYLKKKQKGFKGKVHLELDIPEGIVK